MSGQQLEQSRTRKEVTDRSFIPTHYGWQITSTLSPSISYALQRSLQYSRCSTKLQGHHLFSWVKFSFQGFVCDKTWYLASATSKTK